MYLKKVDIQGFKSFAEKTEVEFNSKVTAIVGPNGSGKSNIADAIRWVLGEQSVKSLRGNRMEDVIFSGTEKRKALGFSEVTITFDNTEGKIPIDYREVAVTRRMFRSGESEYYINKNSCRLKDIRELFMDTGVGKEGYSIIGQGKIDEILSNKPEDRRNIFEEAAGIIKYKTRKLESLKKLEKTESNLSRIGDLLYEIRNQKDQLKNEAEKAYAFQKLFNQLRNLDVAMSTRDIKRVKQSKGKLESREFELSSERDLLNKESLETESFFAEIKGSINITENLIEEKRSIKLEKFQKNESIKSDIKLLEEKDNYLNKEIERLNREIKETYDTYSTGSEFAVRSKIDLEKTRTSLSVLDSMLSSLIDERKSLQIEIEKLESKSAILRDDLFSEQGKSLEIKSEASTIDSFRSNIERRILQIQDELLEVQTAKTKADFSKEKFSKEREFNSIELKNRMSDVIELETMLGHNLSKKMNLEGKISEIQKQLGNSITTLELYKNMEREFDGYFGSVKSVAQRAALDDDIGKGYIGIVADLFSVEKKYVTAIETALGSSIQNIAVENEKSAKKMIQYLKDKKKGRATFLPITTIKGQEIKIFEKSSNSNGFIGIASNLIEYEEKLDGIFKFLLGRTIVFDNLENALDYSKANGYRNRLVTLEGDVVNPGGSLTGGSSGGRNISLLSRKQSIVEIEEEIIQLNNRICDFENDLMLINQESAKLTKKLDDSKISVRTFEDSIKELDFALVSVSNSIEKFVGDLNKKDQEMLSLRDELLQLDEKQAMIKITSSNIDESIYDKKDELAIIVNNLNSLYNKKNDLEEKINSTKLEWNISKNKAEVLNREIDVYIHSEENMLNSLKLKEAELKELTLLIENGQSKIIKLIAELDIFSNSEQMDSAELGDLLKEKDRLMNSFYDLQERNRLLTQRLSKVEREIDKIDVDREKFDLQIQSITDRILTEYDLDINDMLDNENIIENVREDQNIIKDLRAKIKDLGNVNMSSIDDYKSISDRFEFLTGQLSDLNSARGDIQTVIKDMEKKMRLQFRKSFDEINEKFSMTFATLFNGGKARLELESEEDILTSGIDIMAQPPGKKLQSLMLLSGGEKSLTAVALLFAILKTKPSPFCILDEIDAALDEANISRYTNFLKTFDEETQFVLITHRKTTMEIADVLYGVTMEEEGVSRMISLKLRNYNEAAG